MVPNSTSDHDISSVFASIENTVLSVEDLMALASDALSTEQRGDWSIEDIPVLVRDFKFRLGKLVDGTGGFCGSIARLFGNKSIKNLKRIGRSIIYFIEKLETRLLDRPIVKDILLKGDDLYRHRMHNKYKLQDLFKEFSKLLKEVWSPDNIQTAYQRALNDSR